MTKILLLLGMWFFVHVLEDGTILSASVTSAGVVTLSAAAKGKLIIDGTLDIECNY